MYLLLIKINEYHTSWFAYATYGGLTITVVTIFGIFKYNQIPNSYAIIGISFIIMGVILLNTLGKTN